MLIKEEWRDIDGYGGVYQISNLGRVKSVDRYITYINGITIFTKGKILNGFKKQNGYRSVDLYRNGVKRKYYIHRLVAFAFVHNPKPEVKFHVNHKDENRANNNSDNLEWVTVKENLNHGGCRHKISVARINHPNISIPVCQYSLDGKLVEIFPSASEAGRQLKIPNTSITRNCKGKTQTCHGFIWKYFNKGGVA